MKRKQWRQQTAIIDAFGITWASFDSFILFLVGRDSRTQELSLLQAMESGKVQACDTVPGLIMTF